MSVDRRDQFLLHLYDKLWDSIDRSESGVWQFVGLNAALFAVIALIYTDKLPVEIAGFFGIVIVFWGINIVINSGWWFSHNLNIVRNIEQEFISEKDYGRILPKAYKQPRLKVLNTLGVIHLLAFTSLGVGLIVITSFHPWILIVVAVGIVLTYIHYRWYAMKSLTSVIEVTQHDKPNENGS